VQEVFHQFNPHGLSGVIVIAESHLAIHTWPEYGVAAIDLFTCDPNLKAEAAIAYIAESLEARAIDTKKNPAWGYFSIEIRRRIISSGQNPVNDDCKRFAPTKAVKNSQFGE
jgi:hypothetical protein